MLKKISWNFQEFFTTICHTAPPILSFYSNDYGVSQSKTRTLPYKTWGSGGYHFVSIAHSISSLKSMFGSHHEESHTDCLSMKCHVTMWIGHMSSFHCFCDAIGRSVDCLTSAILIVTKDPPCMVGTHVRPAVARQLNSVRNLSLVR